MLRSWKILTILLMLSFESCITDEQVALIPYSPEGVIQPTAEKKRTSPEDHLKALEEVAPRGSRESDILLDVFALLDAEELISKDRNREAQAKLKEALAHSQGRFARKIFKRWANFYFAQLGKKVDVKVAASLVWAETDQGQIVDHWDSKKIKAPEDIEPILRKTIPRHLESTIVEDDSLKKLPSEDYLKSDPLLSLHSKAFCRLGTNDDWRVWEEKLDPTIAPYWEGRKLDCLANFHDAAVSYEKFLASLDFENQNSRYASLALNAGYRLTAIYRWIDKRSELADAYKSISSIWKKLRPDKAAYEQNDLEFGLRRINDELWTARYRALVGDFDLAEKLANDAMKKAEKLDNGTVKRGSKSFKLIKEYRAEAHHILAYRIGLELGRVESARAQVSLGLEISDLPEDWVERFRWYKAFYAYMDGDYEVARRDFEEFLNDLDENHSYRTKVYYWLSMTYRKLNRDDEAEFYFKALRADHPLSYYTIVSLAQQGEEPLQKFLKKSFGKRSDLLAKLKDKRKFDLRSYQKDPITARLLRRAQILVKANIAPYSIESVKELRSYTARKNLTIEEEIYLSRLQFVAGDYFGAVSQTTSLMNDVEKFWEDYPEQILVYFPVAYMDAVQNYALEYGLDPEDVLAVIRQESTFRVEVSSPAGARGLMQLMPDTAERLYASMPPKQRPSLEDQTLQAKLYTPGFNVLMGTKLLKQLFEKYQGRRAPSYASYNAGEYVVDIWLERRRQEDTMLWVETMPFSETAGYVKNVWRNYYVYKYLSYQQNEFALTMREAIFGYNLSMPNENK